MRFRVADLEVNGDLGIERIFGCNEERQAIRTDLERVTGEQLVDPAVVVGKVRGDLIPGLTRLTLQLDPDSASGNTFRGIEDVRADSAQSGTSLSSRSRVILSCSSAAMRISASGEFCRRDCTFASNSCAVLPVAHTIKIYPNFWR